MGANGTMEHEQARLGRRLRQAGLRPTRQRLALAALLFAGPDRHVSAKALFEEATAAGVRVSLATVYNLLNQFTAAGLLREVVVASDCSYFDTNTEHHHHFFLPREGRLLDIPLDRVVLADLPAPPEGGTVARVDVVIRVDPIPASAASATIARPAR
jgi:Fur family iron response transcriptional regulator